MAVFDRLKLWPMKPSSEAQDALEHMALAKHLSQDMPAIVAYKIDNGYLVQMRQSRSEYEGGLTQRSGFFYCADHAAIADYIVSCNARAKLGVDPTRPSAPPTMNHQYPLDLRSNP